MSEKKTIRAGAVCLLVSLLAALFFTACVSKAVNAADKIELGQKYLTELNYTEAMSDSEVENANVACAESVTIQKGTMYQMVNGTVDGWISDIGGVVFCAK